MKTPEFGSKETTKIIDKEGSTLTTTTNYKDFKKVAPERCRYKYRHRVHTPKDEKEVIDKFFVERDTNPRILDSAIEYARTADGDKNGYYYVITCYTVLEY